MNGLIRFSLNYWHTVIVGIFTVLILGSLAVTQIPIDILPVFKAPAVQVLTFYGGMPATTVEQDISNRMERWTGQAAGTYKQESRSIIGASVVRNYYREDIDPNGALSQVNSLASGAVPYLPPGTLPPVILPFDPTGVTPIGLIALDSKKYPESILTDVGRYEVRNMVMSRPGAIAPVVYGGRLRAVLAYLDREKLQARNLSAQDVAKAIDDYNIFFPSGALRIGNKEFALDSNSMYELVEAMGNIPIRSGDGKTVFLRDVAEPKDTSLVQTSLVRVNGRRQVYIPIYRQTGSSTLDVITDLREQLPDIQSKLNYSDIDLKLVMDQSVYVRHSIESLVEEGVLGAILCSLVILLFLGEWRMTLIAVLTIPISVLVAVLCMRLTGNTINVMTLTGLALAIGPLIDIAIICLENTHRHLGMGIHPKEAALYGASEVALPVLVASCCTLLVLAPLGFVPGIGTFLFKPMALAVGFCMVAAYLLSSTFVPVLCSLWLRPHALAHPQHGTDYSHRLEHEHAPPRSLLGKWFFRWESLLTALFARYGGLLEGAVRHRWKVLGGAAGLFVAVTALLTPKLRREFFPEVDAGAFEIYVRAGSGTRLEETERRVAEVEDFIKDKIGADIEIVISEVGVVADWSAAFTPNAGPMDAVVKVQLTNERSKTAQQYVNLLRQGFRVEPQFQDLEFSFDAGGMLRSALNEGKSTPLNVRITGKNQDKSFQVARAMQDKLKTLRGVVDCRILQRLDYPQYIIDVDQSKASALGLTQGDVMRNLVAALNSSIQYNKKNFWIDPVSHNQYYVGVQYPEKDIQSLETLLDIPVTGAIQNKSIPLRQVATVSRATVPTELTHTNLQTTIDLSMGVQGRDLGHVADDVRRALDEFGQAKDSGGWVPFEPGTRVPISGSMIQLSGEYSRMLDTFKSLGIGLTLAVLLIYFLMVALFKSWLTPLVILSAVPIGTVGVLLLLYGTKTAINVQSLLGVIFMIGIVVSNTVLLVDFAQHLRHKEKLSPTAAILKAACVRVRPVVMTALAALFAVIPMALGLGKGSEANVPLGRAVIGGLLAGLPTTLFVVPALYSLVVKDGTVRDKAHPVHA